MNRLKELRKAKGMTQSELALAVGFADPTIDQATISVLERGEFYPSEKLRDALCRVLGCTEDDLYDGVESIFVPAPTVEYSESTKLLSEIFRGHGRITRRELRRRVSDRVGYPISDRAMREWISRARREGMVICNSQDGSGYYRPETRGEYERQLRQNESRAMAILVQNKFIRAKLREIDA